MKKVSIKKPSTKKGTMKKDTTKEEASNLLSEEEEADEEEEEKAAAAVPTARTKNTPRQAGPGKAPRRKHDNKMEIQLKQQLAAQLECLVNLLAPLRLKELFSKHLVSLLCHKASCQMTRTMKRTRNSFSDP